MRPTRDIRRLRVPTVRGLKRLWGLVDSQSRVSYSDRDKRILGYAVIELQNIWIGFVKNYFLSCAIRARLSAGARVSHVQASVGTPREALDEAVYYLNPKIPRGGTLPKRREPNWVEPNTLINLTKHFGFSNRGDIYAALSYQPAMLRSLPQLRNFFAHKNHDTFQVAMNMATKLGVSVRNPYDIALVYPPKSSQALLQDWIDDMVFMVDYLCR